jgi:hypothetical protein
VALVTSDKIGQRKRYPCVFAKLFEDFGIFFFSKFICQADGVNLNLGMVRLLETVRIVVPARIVSAITHVPPRAIAVTIVTLGSDIAGSKSAVALRETEAFVFLI